MLNSAQKTSSAAFEGDGATRLDQLLLRALAPHHPLLSRHGLKKACKAGVIRIVHTGDSRKTSLGLSDVPARLMALRAEWNPDELGRIETPRANPAYSGPEIPVLHEDGDILVLDKPSGVPTLPHSSSETHTGVNRFLSLHPEAAELPPGGLEPGLLHRLDTETSGCLAFAKTKQAWERLRAAWKTPEVRKFYLATVGGTSEALLRFSLELPLELAHPIGHSAKSSRRMIVVDPCWSEGETRRRIRGAPQPARTRIIRVAGGAPEQGRLELEIEIFTGVQHQIRAHLAAWGFPILGDPIYGGGPGQDLQLRASRLILPSSSGASVDIRAPRQKPLK